MIDPDPLGADGADDSTFAVELAQGTGMTGLEEADLDIRRIFDLEDIVVEIFHNNPYFALPFKVKLLDVVDLDSFFVAVDPGAQQDRVARLAFVDGFLEFIGLLGREEMHHRRFACRS